MYYYEAKGKNGGLYYVVQDVPANNDKYTQITKASYEQAMAKNEREEKEAQLRKLMAELYPPEED